MRFSKFIVPLAIVLGASIAAQDLPFSQSAFSPGESAPAGWRTWSQRAETMPRVYVDAATNLGEPGALAVSGDGNPAAYGGWERELAGIVPGNWYRLEASYRARGVEAENWQVVARIDWRGSDDDAKAAAASGKRKGQPEYAAWATRDGEWTRLQSIVQAPRDAKAARLQFFLLQAPLGTVWWDAISFTNVPAPQPRNVRVASVNLWPRNTGTKESSLAAFAGIVRERVPDGADIILLPEGVTVVGTGLTYLDVATPVPGPVTEFLGRLAEEKKAYLAAGIYEREGDAVYNTSVLFDRNGSLVGKYRKVYLPREELEGGITPGDSFPVFNTDFGRVGMMICYDVFFPDPARALAAQGAELILMPIWGGPEQLAVARALENGVFLAASGYGHPTYVMNPDGDVIATAPENGTVAFATIDLNRRYRDEWLGDMRTRRLREIRGDIPLPQPGLLSANPR
ncbi:MAG: carbon-nitrogen hydrolase family protein [Bryobacterales bacterium]|nr:carbon-nitrogen hydrolase family protein [Bryobacterales bacterium]